MGKIIYTRGTTCNLTHTYTAPTYFGATLLFTIKTVKNDTDATDLTNAVLTPKRVSMTGSSFPQTTLITINPTDVPATVAPGTYYYSLKIIDSTGAEYPGDSGTFVLNAITTNETS